MLTGMTDGDWALVLKVFRECQSRRGDKGRDDRLFLEAMHFFAVENVAWRRLPERFGNWNSVWKRFSSDGRNRELINHRVGVEHRRPAGGASLS